MDIPLPNDEVFASLKGLLLVLDGMRKVLTDPAMTTVRIVLNLEKMVVKEAKRAFSYLSLFGYVTDAVIVNRLLPGELHDELFKKWQQIHRRYQAEVEQSFEGIPIFNVPLFDSEVVGRNMLLRMAEVTYGEQDPTEHFVHTSPQRIEKSGPEYVLSLKVPFVDRSAVDLSRHNGVERRRSPRSRSIDSSRLLPGFGHSVGARASDRDPAARARARGRGLLPRRQVGSLLRLLQVQPATVAGPGRHDRGLHRPGR